MAQQLRLAFLGRLWPDEWCVDGAWSRGDDGSIDLRFVDIPPEMRKQQRSARRLEQEQISALDLLS